MQAPDLPVYVDQSMRYTDFLSITLTALGLILAGLAIFIAIMAYFGQREIIAAGKRQAKMAVRAELARFFAGKEGKDLIKEVTGAVPQTGADAQKVAEEYPQ